MTLGLWSDFFNQFRSNIAFFNRPLFAFFLLVISLGDDFAFIFLQSLAFWDVIYYIVLVVSGKMNLR